MKHEGCIQETEEHSLAASGSLNKTDIQEGQVDMYVRTILKSLSC